MDSQEKVQQRVRFTSHAHQLKQRKFVCVANGRCLAYLKKLKELLDRAIGFTSVKPIFEKTKETDDHMGWVFCSLPPEMRTRNQAPSRTLSTEPARALRDHQRETKRPCSVGQEAQDHRQKTRAPRSSG